MQVGQFAFHSSAGSPLSSETASDLDRQLSSESVALATGLEPLNNSSAPSSDPPYEGCTKEQVSCSEKPCGVDAAGSSFLEPTPLPSEQISYPLQAEQGQSCDASDVSCLQQSLLPSLPTTLPAANQAECVAQACYSRLAQEVQAAFDQQLVASQEPKSSSSTLNLSECSSDSTRAAASQDSESVASAVGSRSLAAEVGAAEEAVELSMGDKVGELFQRASREQSEGAGACRPLSMQRVVRSNPFSSKQRVDKYHKILLLLFVQIPLLPFTLIYWAVSAHLGSTWRRYEKYHFLAEQTLGGVTTAIDFSLHTEETKARMRALIESVKSDLKEPLERADEAKEPLELHLRSALGNLIKAQSAQKPGTDCRTLYKGFLRSLRQAMATSSYRECESLSKGSAELSGGKRQEELYLLANEICYAIYTQCNMTSFGQAVLDHVVGHPAPTPSIDENLQESGQQEQVEAQQATLELAGELEQLEPLKHKIVHAGSGRTITLPVQLAQSLRGHYASWGFDPNMQGNPPYRKFEVTMKGGKQVGNLRMATPTLNREGSRVEIVPEFKGYLRALAKRGKRHTYINFQQNWGGNRGENLRSELLQQLNEEREFSSVLCVITLDKNSHFYQQSKEFADLNSARFFKETFVERLFGEQCGFYIPKRIGIREASEEKESVRLLLDELHEQLFGGQEELDRQQRRNFIELAYTLLIDRWVGETGADFYNNSCKDCIDRGGGANALMYYTLLLRSEQYERSPWQQRLSLLPSMTYTDALWARKREIISERLERALGAAQVLLEAAQSEESSGLKWMHEKMNFEQVSVELDPMQRIAAAWSWQRS